MAKEQRLVVNSFAKLKDFILKPMKFCAINITGDSLDVISIEQCQALAEALKLHSGRIILIKISNVCINDVCAIMICEALASRRVPSDYHPSTLDFRHNYLTDDSVSALKSLGSKVKILHLDNNYFRDGALQFKGSILAN
jgi:hypothetical protein